jgi:two-component system sensor histidine kinase KdpD
MLDTFTRQNESSDPKGSQELIDDISLEAERLNKLINNLLQITQLQEGKIKLHKQPHALNELIKKAMQRIDKKLNAKPVKIQLPDNLPQVLIEQVLVNLLENAIIYTPLETSIEISASVAEDDIMISVADRGAGLMMEDISKVFEEFYRGETPKEEIGTGLGLSVCKSIIEAHGGRIWAENRWNGGAIFYFVLPLRDSSENK